MKVQKALDVLGVDRNSSLEEAKLIYLKKVKTFHPDRFASNETLKVRGEEKLKEINVAFETVRQVLKPAGDVSENPSAEPEKKDMEPDKKAHNRQEDGRQEDRKQEGGNREDVEQEDAEHEDQARGGGGENDPGREHETLEKKEPFDPAGRLGRIMHRILQNMFAPGAGSSEKMAKKKRIAGKGMPKRKARSFQEVLKDTVEGTGDETLRRGRNVRSFGRKRRYYEAMARRRKSREEGPVTPVKPVSRVGRVKR